MVVTILTGFALVQLHNEQETCITISQLYCLRGALGKRCLLSIFLGASLGNIGCHSALHFFVLFSNVRWRVDLVQQRPLLPFLELHISTGKDVNAGSFLRVADVGPDEVLSFLLVKVVASPAVHLAVLPASNVMLPGLPNLIHPPPFVFVVPECPLVHIPRGVLPQAKPVLFGAEESAVVLRSRRERVAAGFDAFCELQVNSVGGGLLHQIPRHRFDRCLNGDLLRVEGHLRHGRCLDLRDEHAVVPHLLRHAAVQAVPVDANAMLPVALVRPDEVLGRLLVEDVDALTMHRPVFPLPVVLLAGVGKLVDTPSVLFVRVVLALVRLTLRVFPVSTSLLLRLQKPSAVRGARREGVLLPHDLASWSCHNHLFGVQYVERDRFFPFRVPMKYRYCSFY
eukprot:Rhum_TRINITY_DN15740_c0_g1::Rhum_TRINITY_DN15740_c0_g1_i1::g.161954::m.161954